VVDGDGLGVGVGEAVGEADSDADEDGLTDGLGDGLADVVAVPGEEMVSAAGVISAGTGPVPAPRVDDADRDGDVLGSATDAPLAAVDERVAVIRGWSFVAEE